MAQVLSRLNPKTVAGVLPPGSYSDGGNLYLQVSPRGSKRWEFIYRWKGREIQKGLGSLNDISLARARERAAAARAKLAEGEDPFLVVQDVVIPTFGEFSDDVVATLTAGFKNRKHRDQWTMTLAKYAKSLREIPLDKITTDDVLAVLKPIWTRAPVTADRTRQRIERVLDAAEARGFRNRSSRNPASWKGNLKHLLPARRKLTRGHHIALPHAKIAGFMTSLRTRASTGRLALEFAILTAARSGEVYGATWREIEGSVWIVPKERMKAQKEHRVPLSKAALSVLDRAPKSDDPDAFLFPGFTKDPTTGKLKPLSSMTMAMLMRKMKSTHIKVAGELRAATPHGFRSSFRDWAGSETEYPRELAEEALAHLVGNAVERAYRRGDALNRRRAMMEDWAEYVTQGTPVGAPDTGSEELTRLDGHHQASGQSAPRP